VLLQLGPRNGDEALSLLLMTEDLFQRWAADAYGDANPLTTDAEREWDALTPAFSAVLRFLIQGGATSPLVKTYFRKDYHVPLAERFSDAVRKAALILNKPMSAEAGGAVRFARRTLCFRAHLAALQAAEATLGCMNSSGQVVPPQLADPIPAARLGLTLPKPRQLG
jgi:hypothetical protein